MKFHVLSANDRFISLINMSIMSRNTRPNNSNFGVPWDIQDCIRALCAKTMAKVNPGTAEGPLSLEDLKRRFFAHMSR